MERSPDFTRIFCNPNTGLPWWKLLLRRHREMASVTPEMVADRIDAFLAKQR
jgi:hypothetical protein